MTAAGIVDLIVFLIIFAAIASVIVLGKRLLR